MSTSDKSGCGWIATYNLLHLLGNHKAPEEVINYLDENGGTLFQAAFGVNPAAILRSMVDNNREVTFMRVKSTILIFAILLCTALSACEPLEPMPYGVWENAELGLWFDFDPNQNGNYRGTYTKDDTVTVTSIGFYANSNEMSITLMPDPNATTLYYENEIYSGYYKLDGDVLTLTSRWKTKFDFDDIVFTKIKSYDEP